MLRTTGSWRSTLAKLGLGKSRKRQVNHSRHRSRTFCCLTGVERLEDRRMFAFAGSFDNTSADVFATGGIVASIPGSSVPNGVHTANGDPTEVDAGFDAPVANSNGIDSASGRINIGAVRATPEGGHSTLAYASTSGFADVSTHTSQFPLVDGSSTNSDAYAKATGIYDVNVADVDDPMFNGHWFVSSLGGRSGNSFAERYSSHRAEITTRIMGVSSETWYIRADNVAATFDPWPIWHVQIHLPGEEDEDFYLGLGEFEQPLHIERNLSWVYDGSDEVEIFTELSMDAKATVSDGFGTSASANMVANTQAALSITTDLHGVQYIPGGLPILSSSPPKVKNVIIGSTTTNSYNNNPDYYFDGYVGSGEQLKTVPVGGANLISVQFSKDVVVDSNDLELIALNYVGQGRTPTLIEEPSSGNGYIATWQLSGTLEQGQFLLRLADSIVRYVNKLCLRDFQAAAWSCLIPLMN
jgi:hypothetical protein